MSDLYRETETCQTCGMSQSEYAETEGRCHRRDHTWYTFAEPCPHGHYSQHVDEDEVYALSGDRIQLGWCEGLPAPVAVTRTIKEEQ